MATYENIFAHEFTDMMNQRKSHNYNFSISDIPYPDMGLIDNDSYVAGGKIAYIKGIIEPYFEELNKQTVEVVKGRVFEKRVVLVENDGTVNFRKDKVTGKYMTKEIELEPNFVAVYSSVNIHLPNKIEKNGVVKNYNPTHGFSYIDYVDTEYGRKYLYTVPMEAVYPLELCALVIALNKHRAYYKGCKVALTNGHYVYIYSIPYKYRENAGYILIGAKTTPNFDKEMDELLKYWMEEDILFNLNDTALQSDVKGNMNLGIQSLPGTVNPDDYRKIDKPLRGIEELDSDIIDEI